MHQYAMVCARCGEASPRSVEKVFNSRPGAAGPKSNASVKREVRINQGSQGVRVVDAPWNESGTKGRLAAPHWEHGTNIRTPPPAPEPPPPPPPPMAPPSLVYQARTEPMWIKEPENTEPVPEPRQAEPPVLFASVWQRSMGWTIDAAAISGVTVLAILGGLTAFGWGALEAQFSRGFDDVFDGLVIGRGLWIFGLLLPVVVAFVYATVSHALVAATPGQLLVGLRVETRDGEHPTVSDCAWRSGIAIVAMAIGGLSAIWALFDPQKLTLHDRLVGTRVVRVPPVSAPPEV